MFWFCWEHLCLNKYPTLIISPMVVYLPYKRAKRMVYVYTGVGEQLVDYKKKLLTRFTFGTERHDNSEMRGSRMICGVWSSL